MAYVTLSYTPEVLPFLEQTKLRLRGKVVIDYEPPTSNL